jgi:hypothetical protein
MRSSHFQTSGEDNTPSVHRPWRVAACDAPRPLIGEWATATQHGAMDTRRGAGFAALLHMPFKSASNRETVRNGAGLCGAERRFGGPMAGGDACTGAQRPASQSPKR